MLITSRGVCPSDFGAGPAGFGKFEPKLRLPQKNLQASTCLSAPETPYTSSNGPTLSFSFINSDR